MFRPSPDVVAALRPLAAENQLATTLAAAKPDLTDVLLNVAKEQSELPPVLLAAATRAACARLGKRHGGRAIELRIPPYAAVQLAFGSGPRHTRGTPPNVVEMDPSTFLALVVGRIGFEQAKELSGKNHRFIASGPHALEVEQAFPLT